MSPKPKFEIPASQKSIASFFKTQPTFIKDSLPKSPAQHPQPAVQTVPEASASVVGRRISVFWSDDDAWYTGEVVDYDPHTSKHFIVYDDGDEEWIVLTDSNHQVLQKAVPGRNKKRAVVSSSSSSEACDGGDNGAESDYAVSSQEEMSDDVTMVSEHSEEDEISDAEDLQGGDGDEEAPAPKRKKHAAPAKPIPKSKEALTAVDSKTPAAVNNSVLGLTPNLPVKTPQLRATKDAKMITPPSATALKVVVAADDVERFAGRDAQRFPWAHPDCIRDAQKRRPTDPGYDHTTVYIPPDWFVQNKVSPGQRQWWDFKSCHWDAVLLFKMGKFYEMFEMDAKVGAEVLGLSFMKGEQPHCGFPEAAYHQMAETLARAGKRVVVIEQTETPDGLAARNEERKRKGMKKDSVVRREKVAVLSKGTLTDAEMLMTAPEAAYLLTLVELPVPQTVIDESSTSITAIRPKVWSGVCAVDVASGHVLLGQWFDDETRTLLRSALTALHPVEIVLPKGLTSNTAKKTIQGLLRNPLINEFEVGSDKFWHVDRTWEELLVGGVYFESVENIPDTLKTVLNDKDGNLATLMALGGCLGYLRDAMLDTQVMKSQRFQLVGEAYGVLTSSSPFTGADDEMADEEIGPLHVCLDGAALENLEVLENADGGSEGSLLAAVDHCVTPAGRRLLRQWLCRPLFRVSEIRKRQNAIADLIGPAREAACSARSLFGGLADLERSIARLIAAGSGCGSARDAPHVVLYEDVARKKVQAFVNALKGLQRVQDAVHAFKNGENCSSTLLTELVTPGLSFPDMTPALQKLLTATDWSAAEETGCIVPAPGIDQHYDAAVAAVTQVNQNLEHYLSEIQGELGKSAKLVSLNRESHVIEVPETVKVPSDWEPMQGKKGVKRFTNEVLKRMVKDLEAAKEEVEKQQSNILRSLMSVFAESRGVWCAAVECMAQLDTLMSLAIAADCGSGPMCRPTFVVPLLSVNNGAATFKAGGLRHPAGLCASQVSGGQFVPNDVQLGGDCPPFIVLTGPNMGGKSTLMRQVCLATLLAQIGAWVPADSLELSPVDALFVRMGARDRIMLGHSTFFIELSETAGALTRATQHSLVALDELGRGTATTDGAAIAASVLDYLASEVKCRGIFATHYHHISDSHINDRAVSLRHMACKVTEDGDDTLEEVTFLYKLTDGPCPKSYGVNVARLAGLPMRVVKRAGTISRQTESATVEDEVRKVMKRVQSMLDGGGDTNNNGEIENLRMLQRELIELC